jgi:group I intron endonuclease
MIIYKITNTLNGKMYIGQTIRSIEERWKRHKNDALNNILNTHFARAIRYYGPEVFTVEVIDIATTQ